MPTRSGSPISHDLAVLEQQRAVAEALHRAHVVGDEQDRLPLRADALELVEALLLERGVADGEHLVDEQDVGVDLDHTENASRTACPTSSS